MGLELVEEPELPAELRPRSNKKIRKGKTRQKDVKREALSAAKKLKNIENIRRSQIENEFIYNSHQETPKNDKIENIDISETDIDYLRLAKRETDLMPLKRRMQMIEVCIKGVYKHALNDNLNAQKWLFETLFYEQFASIDIQKMINSALVEQEVRLRTEFKLSKQKPGLLMPEIEVETEKKEETNE